MPRKTNKQTESKSYNHGEEHPQRPDIGTEPQFKKKKPPVTYRYDSSLSPELDWDDNPAREEAEALIKQILEAEDLETAKVAARKLKAMSEPFLNWTGKAERLSFEVPTLPLFVHERLSTRAIIETLKSHKIGSEQLSLFELFSDPKWSITPAEEILVDRPEVDNSIVRVCSPFTIEGTIPPPVEMEDQDEPETEAVAIENSSSYEERMLEILRKSPVLRLPGNRTITLNNVRQPTRTQNLSAEAMVKASDLEGATLREVVDETLEENLNQLPLSQKPVAFLFGPENGAIAERTVYEAAREAHHKQYAHLFVIGFAIAPNARQFVEHCQETIEIPATYIQATPDLLMGDLLKNMRSSQIFSVCGMPEIKLHTTEDGKYQVELLGLDVFDPITMEVDHELGKNVPAWFLDTDYNGLCFHVNQAFFPRTSAWDSIKKALKGTYEESVWEHLSGTISAPFESGEHLQIAVKVIDDRGNELLVVKNLSGG